MRTWRIKIEEISSFQKSLEKALAMLAKERTAAVPIPEGQGMMLVRDGTPEASERKSRPGTILYPVRDGDGTFLVCLN
jgi:hypothetical protein